MQSTERINKNEKEFRKSRKPLCNKAFGGGSTLIGSRKAFTLAETIIVLVILGIVAAITIPALVRRHMENANRTRIKKAMTVYDTILNKMVVENGIKNDTALEEFAGNEENDCAGSSQYFKVTEGSGCVFKTAEGVWWDITDIKRPIVAFNSDNLTKAMAEGDTNDAFYFIGHLDQNSSVRVNDPKAESGEDIGYLTKLYNFVKPEIAGGAIAGGGDDNNGLHANGCDPADDTFDCSESGCFILDCHGNELIHAEFCQDLNDINSCDYKYAQIFNRDDLLAADGYGCDDVTDISTCTYKSIYLYDLTNNMQTEGRDCEDVNNISNCEYKNVYSYDLTNNVEIDGYECENVNDIQNCQSYVILKYPEDAILDPTQIMQASDYEREYDLYGCSSPSDTGSCNMCHGDYAGVNCGKLGYTSCSSSACCKAGFHYYLDTSTWEEDCVAD